ncbi:hypothetical protein [Nocardioides rubriscoriae]|uniref:hypothetical protein n=1 Tax=Nocardioides rubriscoriae TaxID=642762 RepID=UPI0011E03C41|nr:hypothetical protein [Nocardioides rubriscoriae]
MDAALANRWGFAASETSHCDELPTSTTHCAAGTATLLVSSSKASEETARIQRQRHGLDLMADHRAWGREKATPERPLSFDEDIFGTTGWCEFNYPVTRGVRVLGPSRFVKFNDFASLRAVLETSADLPSNVIPTVATEARMLNVAPRARFLDTIAHYQHRPTAFVFADKDHPLETYVRLAGIRQLLDTHPRVLLPYVEPLVASDALAHGAEWVGIGASSARRFPKRPGDKGGGPVSKGYLPGLFLRDYLEFRSPEVYAEWFANSASPVCGRCSRALDLFSTSPTDKAAIVRHNIHAMHEFLTALMEQPAADRAAWLNGVRVEALDRHLVLAQRGGAIRTGETLRLLLELDDPQMRRLSPAGIWS